MPLILCLVLLLSLTIAQPIEVYAKDLQSRYIVFDFHHEAEQMPDHLCVVSPAHTFERNLGQRLNVNTKPERGESLRYSFEGGEDAWQSWFSGAADDTTSEFEKIEEAMISMARNAESRRDPSNLPRCNSAFFPECQPSFVLKAESSQKSGAEKYKMACTPNSSHAGDRGRRRPRVLVVSVNFQNPYGRQPKIWSIRFDGSVATVSLDKSEEMFPRAVVGVVGGDYVDSHLSYYTDRGQLDVPIVSRCAVHTIKLPPVVSTHEQRSTKVYAHLSYLTNTGQSTEDICRLEHEPNDQALDSPCSCESNIDTSGRFEMVLPFKKSRGEKRLFVRAYQSEKDEDVGAFEVRWLEDIPPKLMNARAKEISFEWRRHCLFPKPYRHFSSSSDTFPECPIARMVDVGIHCGEGILRAGRCHYRCSSLTTEKIDRALDLPQKIRFQRGTSDDIWEIPLNSAGQVLEGYVPPSKRSVTIDLSAWNMAWRVSPSPLHQEHVRFNEIPRDRISHIEIRGTDGKQRKLKIDTSSRTPTIKMPGLQCGDFLSYKIHGDREFEERVVRVRNGRLQIDHPSESARLVGYKASLGGGMRWGWLQLKDGLFKLYFPFAAVRFGLTYRINGTARKGSAAQKWAASWWDGPYLTCILTRKYYIPIGAHGDHAETYQEANVLFYRLLIGNNLILSLTQVSSLGFGFSIGVGSTVFRRDASKIDQGPSSLLNGHLLYIVRLNRSLSLEFRLSLGVETITIFRSRYNGPPTADSTTMTGPVTRLETGLRFDSW